MPLISYSGPKLDREQRTALIEGFTELARSVDPKMPKGSCYVVVKDVKAEGSSETIMRGDELVASARELEELKARIEGLEKALTRAHGTMNQQSNGMARLEKELKKELVELGSGQRRLWSGEKDIKDVVLTHVKKQEGIYILLTIERLLSLPVLERHKSTIFPFVRKLTNLHKKLLLGSVSRREAEEQYAQLKSEIKTTLEGLDVPSHLLFLGP
jgi:phenylpyruvate tautomerase PptA (4-oxalocrotonate tautomerase family)